MIALEPFRRSASGRNKLPTYFFIVLALTSDSTTTRAHTFAPLPPGTLAGSLYLVFTFNFNLGLTFNLRFTCFFVAGVDMLALVFFAAEFITGTPTVLLSVDPNLYQMSPLPNSAKGPHKALVDARSEILGGAGVPDKSRFDVNAAADLSSIVLNTDCWAVSFAHLRETLEDTRRNTTRIDDVVAGETGIACQRYVLATPLWAKWNLAAGLQLLW